MSKVVLIGSIAFCTLVVGFIAFDYHRTSNPEYKAQVKQKRLEKKLLEKKKKEEEKPNSTPSLQPATGEPKSAAELSQIQEYSIEQSLIAKDCAEKGDIEGFINAYVNIVSVQEDPMKCLEELSQYLPESALVTIAQRVFSKEYFKDFPEKYGFSVETVDGQRIVKASKDYKKGEKLFVCQPTVAYLNQECNVSDFCFFCKKALSDDRVRCASRCNYSYCNSDCESKAVAHKVFCISEEKEPEHPMFGLFKLAENTKRTIFNAIAELFYLIENEQTDQQFRQDFSHLYIPVPRPTASPTTKAEHELMTKWIKPSNDDVTIYVAFLCKIIYNAIPFQTKINEEKFSVSGKGIYTKASYFNHSCTPNIYAYSATGTSELTFEFTEDVKEGQELTINYMADKSDLSKQEQHKLLRNIYDFDCTCGQVDEKPTPVTKGVDPVEVPKSPAAEVEKGVEVIEEKPVVEETVKKNVTAEDSTSVINEVNAVEESAIHQESEVN